MPTKTLPIPSTSNNVKRYVRAVRLYRSLKRDGKLSNVEAVKLQWALAGMRQAERNCNGGQLAEARRILVAEAGVTFATPGLADND